jgi:hypothetical protein
VLPARARDSDEVVDPEREKWLLRQHLQQHFARMKEKEKKESLSSVELDYSPLKKMIGSRKRK